MNRSRLAACASVLVLSVSLVALVAARQTRSTHAAVDKNKITKFATSRLVVHEWGTFTSIAGKDGTSLEWRPLNGVSDLPGFVYETTGLGSGNGLRNPGRCQKCNYEALVRMETPVIYFYADRNTVVSARVDFVKGKITEWYPQARSVYVPNDDLNPSSIDWGRFTVMPHANEDFPIEGNPSHYYPARETDASPLRICGAKGEQHEKFLFYRGVGSFAQPLSVRLDGRNVLAKDNSSEEVKHYILFEKRNGQIGYGVTVSGKSENVLPRPLKFGQTQESLEDELESMLVGQGLYEKEAEAMIKTWRDSWFEEGLRVFYIVPREVTDSILPLTIEPRPTELARVLVGRIEILTPEMAEDIKSSAVDPSRGIDQAAEEILRKHGRFAEPVLKDLLEKTGDPGLRGRIEKVIGYRGTNPR